MEFGFVEDKGGFRAEIQETYIKMPYDFYKMFLDDDLLDLLVSTILTSFSSVGMTCVLTITGN